MKKIVVSALALSLLAGATACASAKADDAAAGATRDITRAQAQGMADRLFTRLDANGDGRIDQADRDAMRAKAFDRLDTNKDGAISREEFAAHKAFGKDFGGNTSGTGPGSTGPGKGPGHRMGRPSGMMAFGFGLLRQADTDRDGVITKAEFDAAVAKQFDSVDTNHDGVITKAERDAARDKLRGERLHRRAPGGTPPAPSVAQ